MNTYELSHHYSRSNSFYGVKAAMTFHELNIMCAYIQLLQCELPVPQGAEDTIGKENGAALLAAIFGLDIVREEMPCIRTLDFYDNWNEYCGGDLSRYLGEIRAVAKPGAFRALLKNMADECRDAIRRYRAGAFFLDSPEKWISETEKNIDRLQFVINGGAVAPEWAWRTQDGSDCAGEVFVRHDGEPDFPAINCD
ncbi:hypothetical protein MUA04_14345 [Enterobacteriaceae bacterium H11S18]|uniref:hypothetical protein n=1 Tax=Dryocola clanedunensis TaxID=2925396 RepID=UPI0022F12CCA|nr:hypothetical protein [Dryocola clanedunensis]MCT4711360.1 hypothetical protein [Dryocola clanedunensis]